MGAKASSPAKAAWPTSFAPDAELRVMMLDVLSEV